MDFEFTEEQRMLRDSEPLHFDGAEYTFLGPNRDRDVYGRNGAYYGLEVSRAMQR